MLEPTAVARLPLRRPNFGGQTMTKDTGGPAKDETLLDYFAGLAMQGLISGDMKDSLDTEIVAADAYHLAEAMIAGKRRRENGQ